MQENLETTILNHIRDLQPEVVVKAPARINLINAMDAVEADYWAPIMAVTAEENPLSVYCYIKASHSRHSTLHIYNMDENTAKIVLNAQYNFSFKDLFLDEKFWINPELDIFFGSLHYLFHQIPEFEDKLNHSSYEIGIITTIPRQSGIAGSSSLIIALLYTMGRYCKLTPDYHDPSFFSRTPFNKDTIGEIATKIENNVLQNTAGYGDRITISRGGLAFVSFVGKLHHQAIGNEPLPVYDRIDKVYNISEIPIILAFSGVKHTSGEIHSQLRKQYLAGDPKLIELYAKLAEISWQSRFALMKHDWKTLGEIFDQNMAISEKIMQIGGFHDGIGWANKILTDLIKDHPDVYSVKLSGAGGGGSVFALVSPIMKTKLLVLWKQKLLEILDNPDPILKNFPGISKQDFEQLRNAKFYTIQINTNGVSQFDLQ
ncbi:MAG: GHMP family kinase ATP-binding protein [Promethearchaeota archaeon]